MNARGITVDWQNFYQPRRERITVLQCHGFAPKSMLERCARRAPLNITDDDFEIDKELARF